MVRKASTPKHKRKNKKKTAHSPSLQRHSEPNLSHSTPTTNLSSSAMTKSTKPSSQLCATCKKASSTNPSTSLSPLKTSSKTSTNPSPSSLNPISSPKLTPIRKSSPRPIPRSQEISDTPVLFADQAPGGMDSNDSSSKYDLEIGYLASRVSANAGRDGAILTTHNTSTTPRISLDDYLDLENGSFNSVKSSRHSFTAVDDYYNMVVVPQLEIILDTIRTLQCEVHHIANELKDLSVSSKYALKRIWSYLNYNVDDLSSASSAAGEYDFGK